MEQMVFITKDECQSLINLIDCSLFDIIREDEDIDSLEWLANIMRIYDRAKSLVDKEED